MVLKNMEQIYTSISQQPKKRVVVAMPEDSEVLRAINEAIRRGLADFILCGNVTDMKQLAQEHGLALDAAEFHDEKDPRRCAELAVSLITDHKADILMKGILDSTTFLKAIFHSNPKLCLPDSLLTSIALIEHPGRQRLFMITDPGFIVNPDYETKKKILKNAVQAAHLIGIPCPKVAVLSASEIINPNMQSSVDGQALQQDWENHEFDSCVVCGPVSFDLAVNPSAAAHKKFQGNVAGDADILLMPSLEAGNIAYKAIEYFSSIKTGGIVMGAVCPIIFTSRADTADTKLNTIALAAYLYASGGSHDI